MRLLDRECYVEDRSEVYLITITVLVLACITTELTKVEYLCLPNPCRAWPNRETLWHQRLAYSPISMHATGHRIPRTRSSRSHGQTFHVRHTSISAQTLETCPRTHFSLPILSHGDRIRTPAGFDHGTIKFSASKLQ